MDEDNEDDRVAKALTGAGMTVVKATPAGNSGKPDEEQFAFAVENSLVVYTSNFRDFNVLQQIHLAAGLATPE
jgi:environmental stress-induced protein Ves